MQKNVFALLFILVSGNAFTECATSPYYSNAYQESINEDFCLSLSNAGGAEKTIMINYGAGYGDDGPANENYLGLKRISLEIYDWNGDDVADWIRLTNYIGHYSDKPPYQYGAEVIEFYQGPEELRHMLSGYGFSYHGDLETRIIPINEQGTCYYGGNLYKQKFKAISDSTLNEIFSLADALLAHNVQNYGPFASSFKNGIVKIMAKKVLDYPAEWRDFN